MKSVIKRILCLSLGLFMVVGLVPTHVFAAVKRADWNFQTAAERSDAWPLGQDNEIVRVFQASGLKTPSVNYTGIYRNAEGRQVIRLTFDAFQNAAYRFTNLIVKLPQELNDMVDWNHPGTGMYNKQYNGESHDFENHNREITPFKSLPRSITGSINTYWQDLVANKNYIGAHSVASTPMEFVLKEGQSVDQQPEQLLIQTRFMDKDFAKVFAMASSTSTDGVIPYNSYTFNTVIPTHHLDFNKDLNQHLGEFPGPFYGTNHGTTRQVR